jgi:hypothetical protein
MMFRPLWNLALGAEDVFQAVREIRREWATSGRTFRSVAAARPPEELGDDGGFVGIVGDGGTSPSSPSGAM